MQSEALHPLDFFPLNLIETKSFKIESYGTKKMYIVSNYQKLHATNIYNLLNICCGKLLYQVSVLYFRFGIKIFWIILVILHLITVLDSYPLALTGVKVMESSLCLIRAQLVQW